MRRLTRTVAVLGAMALVASAWAALAPSPAMAQPRPFPGFPDVPPGTFFEEPAYWLHQRGLTTGVGETGQFQPRRSITRGETATFLWRYEGRPRVARPAPFRDVGRGAYFDPAVRWLAAEGHTTGVGNTGEFRPWRDISRAEVATLLWRYAGRPAPRQPAPFPDVPAGTFYADAVAWLAQQGLTTGVGTTGLYQPHRPITRGEFATLLWRWTGAPAMETPRLISTFTTPLQPGQSRNTNIRLAMSFIDGDVIRTGGQFSLNTAIGPRTRDRGFVEDGFITGGTTVSDVGGGVSQVATTFLNAAWFAGIRLDQFRPHTIYFERYPMCREATIVWNSLDLVVTNDSPYHVWVLARATDREATVSFFSFPWARVDSWTGQPYAIDRGSGAFSVDCRRTVTYPNGTSDTQEYTWRYVNGGYPG